RRQPALSPAHQRVRQEDGRADPAQHVVQRERADRPASGGSARLLPAHAHGRARARQPRHHEDGGGEELEQRTRAGRKSVVPGSRFLVPSSNQEQGTGNPELQPEIPVHIAFFNRSFYPDTTATGQLLTDLCEDLVREHGCRVSVVTGPPLLATAAVKKQGWGLFTVEEYRGVKIYRVRGTRFSKDRFAGRATNYMTYFFAACWAGLRLERPDVLVAQTDPPIIGLAAWLAGKRFNAPFVMAFKDLFPEVTALLKDFHSDNVNGALQRINKFLTRRAARNLALGEMMKRRLIENKGAPPERTEIIPDWADTTAIAPGP